MYAWNDTLRRAQGEALGACGYGPTECAYRVAATGQRWRLRDYGAGGGPPLVIVAAPIKRPYIWDLAPCASVVRYCLGRGLRVYLLEWVAPGHRDAGAGLDDYVGQAMDAAVARAASLAGAKPFLLGHSLGGTFAAMFAALAPERVAGLVLLSAPLCFHPGVSRFRDALVRTAPAAFSGAEIVPSAVLSQVSALAAPETFVWLRLVDAALSAGDPAAWDIHTRIERWALDEVPVPGMLANQILAWLYREDRFLREALVIRDRAVGPSRLRVPILAAANTADDIAPPGSMQPFLDAMPNADAHFIAHAAESGVGLQHLALLAGRRALARAWPQIVSWLYARR